MNSEISPFVMVCRSSWQWFVRFLGRIARRPLFRRSYALGALALLLSTSVYWAVLGARLQMHNADQLSDPYLFSSWQTFHGAAFPGSHTFLLKWPVFWLVDLFGTTSASLMAATVCLVVLTVAALAAVLYKIDRRPLVFGTLCLALALALLLVPAQPYAGGILPVNMAMLTTRNIEYAVYLLALVLLVRVKKLRSWRLFWVVLLLAILIASDKLFLSLSAGGALLALVVYTAGANWSLATFAVRWLGATLLAGLAAVALLAAIGGLHLTHFANAAAATPYGVTQGARGAVLGVVYAIAGIFTNAGANPAYDNRVIAQLPGDIVHRLWSLSAPAYLIAATGLLYSLFLAARLLRRSLKTPPRTTQAKAPLLALTLIWSSLAALLIFIGTNHYYAVDARYLTIGLFALAVTVSVELRNLQWRWPEDLLLIACGLLVAIGIATATSWHISQGQTAALNPIAARNTLVAQALEHHHADVLVGDYWRVLPIRQQYHGKLTAMPLATCTQPDTTLTSSAWQPDLSKHSFAYLVTLDGSLTNFPNCSLAQITALYGRPNASQLIAGTYAKPAEVLLFYDQGKRRQTAAAPPAAVLPVALQDLSDTACADATTLNIVAHQDDDLLFLSPDLQHDIQSGRCVRTVFLTAGDSGNGKFYWLSRQLGSEAAYGTMLGGKQVWDQQTIKLAADEYITVATPRGNSNVSLLFFDLPDGNLDGQGFASSGYQSLADLWDGRLSQLRTVDGQSHYTAKQLISALSALMESYQPATIRTQADAMSGQYPDHSDHITTGRFAVAAAQAYDLQHFDGALAVPVVRYIGYPIHGYPANVSGSDLEQKEAAFLAYAQYDGGVCHTLIQCSHTQTYNAYLQRQYTENPS